MSRHPTPHDILLLIEVSDASLAYDREDKVPRYAKSGIPEVWLVAVDERQIEQYADCAQGQYKTKRVWSRGDVVASQAVPSLALAVNDVLG